MPTHFGSFVLDSDVRQLTRNGAAVHLTPKAYQLLARLLEERPRVISKAALMKHLWPKAFVAEANLSNLVAEIRSALGDDPRRPTWIRTAHGFGYAFHATATTVPGPSASAGVLRCWLEWGRRRFRLDAGAYLVGRDADVEIRLDSPSVSRRHARIVVTGDGAFLQDCGSKNGTRCGDTPIIAPVRLTDGDAVRFGSIYMTFRERSHANTTVTGTNPADPD
jgi:DNA-binding winged helix-turn-helix (wHTH) protein